MAMEENEDKLQFQRLAGKNIVKFTPFFSPDASLLFVITDNVVQVYSSSTGLCTRLLEGANDPLISLEYDLVDSEVIVACTKEGELIRWKWSTGKLLSRVTLAVKNGLPINTFNLLKLFDDEALCAFITVKGKESTQWFVVNTITGSILKCPLKLLLKRQKPIVDVENNNFNYFAIAQGHHLYVINYKTWEKQQLKNRMKDKITCVKVHPKELMIATGDETGKVFIWTQLFSHTNKYITTLYHWHHTSVTSIAFTYSGSGFYSSGHEAVLVKWDIYRPDRRGFVPRMASAIQHIATSCENTSVAVCTADNGIQILDVDFKTHCTLQDYTYISDDKTGKELFPVGLKVNPRRNTLVLNGRAGHLQFYSPYSTSLLYNMDIVGQNAHSITTNKILYNIQVNQAAFNIDWMATAEIFNDEQHIPELRLKFWEYQEKSQSYSLNTNVELPHEGGVKAIEFSSPFHVDNLLCATAGMDNSIKVWSLEDSNNIYNKGKVWYCIGQTTYKDCTIDSIAFSQDGSLLAAGFGNALCIYKAETLKLLSALLPNGSFDGCLHKAQVTVPKNHRNGSKSDLTSKSQTIMQLFTNLLNANEETLLKQIKKSTKSNKLQELHSLDDSQKLVLYKKIKSLSQLNLFQKLSIYQQLGICFELTKDWQSKIIEYLQANTVTYKNCQKLTKDLNRLNLKSRFKAKYRLTKFVDRKSNYDKNSPNNLLPLINVLKLSKPSKPKLTNGVDKYLPNPIKPVLPPMQSVVKIQKVAFCNGDCAHLVIACTENRVLIWNLLTLRLQAVLKLSTEHIAVDSQTNLISVFTKQHELYVFLPSNSLPLYYRANMPPISGAVWLPRKHPKSQAIIVNWQSRSTLYFLTKKQEIMYLAADDELEESSVKFGEHADRSAIQATTFGTFAKNHFNNTTNSRQADRAVSIGVHGKAAVKSFLEMPTHTMAPLSLLCNDFLKELVELNLPSKKKNSKTKVDAMDISDDVSNDEDDETLIKRRNFAKDLERLSSKATKTTDKTPSEEYLKKIAAQTLIAPFKL